MKYILINKFFCVCVMGVVVIACHRDDIPDPYQPLILPKIDRLDFISGNDSSIFIYDADMVLISGRNNTMNPKGYEWFTMKYADAEGKKLTGAEYNVAVDPDSHRTEREVIFLRDKRNMLSKVTREEWASKSFSLLYDDRYRLTQLTLNESNTVNSYTVTYDDRSNVSSVELYQKVLNVEGTVKHEFKDYDNHPNSFYFLGNVFYAPVFSSNNGAVFFNKISSSLGLLLSKNNPGEVVRYVKNGNDWEETGSSTYSYEYGENNYPVSISGGGLSLKIIYHSLIP